MCFLLLGDPCVAAILVLTPVFSLSHLRYLLSRSAPEGVRWFGEHRCR
ncbi:hypothetical protein RRSWK_03738 [Rhodopirellula sp. SWK7]|nr:hypothetical protein RRSWK_03738 [Rhodopirellula sp. SWK7]